MKLHCSYEKRRHSGIEKPLERIYSRSSVWLAELARKGQLTLGASNDAALYPDLSRLLKRHRAALLLDEERGTR